MANHLAGESSPYLLQHKDNPVDWYPWGPEAMQRAHDEDKPIFLSIGYSACHWCHVMERESFTDTQTAALLNREFVSIKVDREERPDLDEVYMQAVTALTGSGGWPLSVWLTPDGVPFYGGTYFPPLPRYGMPSFPQVLASLTDMWRNRRDTIHDAAESIRRHLTREGAQERPASVSVGDLVATAETELATTVDPDNGGWGVAPKFPQAPVIEFLLAHYAVTDEARREPQSERALRLTLDSMAAGGIHDQLGGGFHRYSTDAAWLVPHFEKMLYDNAQLARCYLHAWQLFGEPRYRRVAEDTLDYLLGRMRHPAGGFFAAEDADSEGREGAFYAWSLSEVQGVLTDDEAALAQNTYGLSERGNFEGANVLHLAGDTGRGDLDGDTLREARAKLLAARDRRPRPARDEKVLTGWNGLALAAFSEAAGALGLERYRSAAVEAGHFIVGQLLHDGDRLAHTWKDGRAAGSGFLDDYACAIDGLLALYSLTFAEDWFTIARRLADHMVEHFRRPAGGFFDTSDEHETLIVRPRSLHDSPTPSGNSMAASVLLKLAAYTGEGELWDMAVATLSSVQATIARAPVMFGQWLSMALLAETGVTQVAIVGDLSGSATADLLSPLRSAFRPHVVVAAGSAGAPTQVPILKDRRPPEGAGAAAWVCRHSSCAAPTSDPQLLADLLA